MRTKRKKSARVFEFLYYGIKGFFFNIEGRFFIFLYFGNTCSLVCLLSDEGLLGVILTVNFPP